MGLADISKKEPDAALVETIKGLLELAERGELRGLAFAGPMLSGEGVTGYTGIRRPYHLVAQLECLKADIIRSGHQDDDNIRITWSPG